MLGISNDIEVDVPEEGLESLKSTTKMDSARVLGRWMVGIFCMFFIILFMPWTQNIQSSGKLTALNPENRPQTVPAVIPGKIEQWYIQEGDYVEKGDTILRISEVKDSYMDTSFVTRLKNQIQAKEASFKSYSAKTEALKSQYKATEASVKLKIRQARGKLEQSRLKVLSDTASVVAAKQEYHISVIRFERLQKLYDQGLKSLTDLESRRIKLRETEAKYISAENKLLQSKNEYSVQEMEVSRLFNELNEKLSKIESDRYSAESMAFNAQNEIQKIQNKLNSVITRSGYYYITAPQNGYLARAMQAGIGEVIKDGESVIRIIPENMDFAVELYVRPIDLPLVQIGEEARLLFDGWPALVFSGWPNMSFGTFGGKVTAIDRVISDNDMYRILIKPDPEDKAWPELLRPGSGAKGIMLLNNVPVWYEIWRQLNAFPPDFYTVDKPKGKKPKLDAGDLMK